VAGRLRLKRYTQQGLDAAYAAGLVQWSGVMQLVRLRFRRRKGTMRKTLPSLVLLAALTGGVCGANAEHVTPEELAFNSLQLGTPWPTSFQ